jgi:hypothetical protein
MIRTLDKAVEESKEFVQGWLKIIKKAKSENDVIHLIRNFHNIHFIFAVKAIQEGDFESAKVNFNTCALVDYLNVKKYNSRLFDFGVNYTSHPLLSDNESIISAYSQLRYHKDELVEYSMDEMVLLGKSCIWANTVQMFMCSNVDGIERNLNILETIVIKRLQKSEKTLFYDYNFYKALYSGNKSAIEEALERLTDPKTVSKRVSNLLLRNHIALPAFGYAKLAWRMGFEADIKSDLIAKELLPLKTLSEYQVPYDFLKFKI